MKFQSAVGGRINVSLGNVSGNVRGPNVQWLIAKSDRDFYPDFFPAGAGVHDEAEGLVVEGLDTPSESGLGSRGPRSNPMILGGISERKTKQKEKREGAVP